MAYFSELFSPETYESFSISNRDITGFHLRQEKAASRIKIGDKFICYMVKLSRWIGVLEVSSKYFRDNSPLFYTSNDPYLIRFKVKSLVWLPKEKSIPIHDDQVWANLSFTKNNDKRGSAWTGKIRNSLIALDEDDGEFLEKLIYSQFKNDKIFKIDDHEYTKYLKPKVQTP